MDQFESRVLPSITSVITGFNLNISCKRNQSSHRPQNTIRTHQFWAFSDHFRTIFGPFSDHFRTHLKIFRHIRHIQIILFNIFRQILTFFGPFSDHFRTIFGHFSDNPLFEVLISSITIANGQNRSEFRSHFGAISPKSPNSDQKSDFRSGW